MKVYVNVVCSFSKKGAIKPLYVVWDKCTIYTITKILRVTPQKHDGTSRLEFECMIGRNQRNLYLEGGKWYFEKQDA